jgi:hypothetical protein
MTRPIECWMLVFASRMEVPVRETATTLCARRSGLTYGHAIAQFYLSMLRP